MPATRTETPAQTRHEDGNRRVVQRGRASTTSSIAHAVVMKNDELFFLCTPEGEVPFTGTHGLGLYYHDCRYLNGYEVRIGETPPDRLACDAGAGFWATFELTNPDVRMPDGHLLEKERLGIKWERTLVADACALEDTFAITNSGVDRVEVPLTIRLQSCFDSLFEVRGAQPQHRGTLHDPAWHGAALDLVYDGADGVRRAVRASFDPAPAETKGIAAMFRIRIEPQKTATVSVSMAISESAADREPAPPSTHASGIQNVRGAANEASDHWVTGATVARSDNPALDRVLTRSLRDLHLLRTTLRGRSYFAAGVPWYVTLFGRDSIIAALETLAFVPDAAEDTVRLLAGFQGTQHDAWRDEDPGKIMHELRVGEMAHLNEIPQTPYYGSVDATPLFLVLLGRHAAWTGRTDLFTELESHVRDALQWIDHAIAAGDNGFLSYKSASKKGLANQGWKDSGDSIVNRDGTLAEPPISLVEVQGYVYLAKRAIADLYRRTGDRARADRLAADADALRQRFEEAFWNDDLGTYALALQKGGRQAAVVSSNPGQALWTGIASRDRAQRTAERLMREDMFSGWGIRTLSAGERRYNPIGYHDGTVWPHDNAIAVAGFRRYGCLHQIECVVSGIVDAATHFEHDRLPEVFAGFDRREYRIPVHYPVACHPQAWAAGAVPFMLESALGLDPDAFERTLRVSQPALPPSVGRLTLDRLRVGDARVRIVFARDAHGRMRVEDVETDGTLHVTVDNGA